MNTYEMKRKVKLICLIGAALHKYGTNAQRLESSLISISENLGLKGDFFSTPTYLAISVDGTVNDEYNDPINHHLRVLPGETNLEKLQIVDTIANDVCHEDLNIETAIEQLLQLEQRPNSYNRILVILAFSATSLALATILKGTLTDIGLSFLLGTVVGLFAILKSSIPKISEIFEFFVSFIVMFLCYFFNHLQIEFNSQVVLISSLIVIIPGLNITIAMNELATQNLVSGTARLMGAMIDFFKISFGILIGIEIGKIFFGTLTVVKAAPLPSWSIYPAILIAALSFTVIFNATKRDFKWVLLSGILTIGSLNISQIYVNNVLSIFFSAFVIGLTSNLFARIKNRPAAITLLPGIIFIVPGSVGLKGINMIFQNDLVAGLAGGVQMLVMAVTIVAGLFLANVCFNPRKTL